MAVLVAVTLSGTGCTGSATGPNGPTPGNSVSDMCAAMLDVFERVKAENEASPSTTTQAHFEAAQERLFESGCLKS